MRSRTVYSQISRLVFPFAVPVFIVSCSFEKVSRNASNHESFMGPASFNNYPASLALLSGDTVHGRFTKLDTVFLQIHENKDSNYNRERRQSWVTAKSYYYRKFTVSSLASYTVNGQWYEPVIPTSKKTGLLEKPGNARYDFMKKVTGGDAPLQLYQDIRQVEERESHTTLLLDLLTDILSWKGDTTISGGYYYFVYYVHFPGEYPHAVWSVDNKTAVMMLKDLFTRIPPGCTALTETARNLLQVSNAKDIQKILGSADSTIRHRRARALMDRIEIYNSCLGDNQKGLPGTPAR